MSIIATLQAIIDSLNEVIAFFEALMAMGAYLLVVQNPDGGLLQGGTDALVQKIQNATGDSALELIDPETGDPALANTDKYGKVSYTDPGSFASVRVKPPDSLRFTAGVCAVVGGPGADGGFKVLKTLLVGAEDEEGEKTGEERIPGVLQ